MSGRDFDIVSKKKERNMDDQDQVTVEGKKYDFIFLLLKDIFSFFLKTLLLLFKLKFMLIEQFKVIVIITTPYKL